MIRRPSPNHEPRPAGTLVDMLVLHYTGMPTAQAALSRLLDPEAKVSAHYLIDEDGSVFALVDEGQRAWHAGVSCWRGKRDVNSRSVGIELVNPGHEFGYRSFPEPQMAALTTLAQDILGRHPIPPRNVVGHSDIAPTRKEDPGELFDWRRLAEQGIGLWPTASAVPQGAFTPLLTAYGYDTSDAKAAAIAFQRHFRPEKFDGEGDDDSRALLWALLRQAE